MEMEYADNGKIVHYVPHNFGLQFAKHLAAIVVWWWSGDLANLFIPPTGIDSAEVGNQTLTSIQRDQMGKTPGTWHFPFDGCRSLFDADPNLPIDDAIKKGLSDYQKDHTGQ